jgi:hypothetical protein
VNEISASDDLREAHVDAIVTLVDEFELAGIDVEYLPSIRI